ncbi:hypothetical protein BH11PSE13_BH11PSE13_05450 [soil metagenome]
MAGSGSIPGMKNIPFEKVRLGQSDLRVTPICLGTMTFGEQVDEPTSHAVLSRSLERGVDFIDTAEMYSVPTRQETYSVTESIIGRWFAANPGARQKLTLATKVAGPSRGMPWVREGAGMTAADIVASCNASLKRLQTDVIDLYQIHWPERNTPLFGQIYFDPTKERTQTSIHEQLEALGGLVKEGKAATSACRTRRLMACMNSSASPNSIRCRASRRCRTSTA